MIGAKRVIVGFVLSAIVVAACSDNTPTAAQPESLRSLAQSVITTNMFIISDTGLMYAGTREQLGSLSGGSFSDEAATEKVLSREELEDASQRVGLEMLSTRVSGSRPALAASMASGTAKFRPRLKNAVTRNIGTDARGRAISMEASSSIPTPNGITSSILVANGAVIAIMKHRWKGSGHNLVPTNSIITLLDSSGQMRVIEDIHVQTTQSVGAWQRTKSGLELAGNALLSFVQPDALHAMPRDEFEEWPCFTETMAVGTATTVLAGATAGLLLARSAAATAQIASYRESALAAEALALCPEAVPICAVAAEAAVLAGLAATAWVTAQAGVVLCEGLAVAASGGLGYATGFLTACQARDQARRDSTNNVHNPIYSSGSGEGGDSCETEWWISYDNGATWAYAYSTFGGCPI